jgi:hypothetical protein
MLPRLVLNEWNLDTALVYLLGFVGVLLLMVLGRVR